MEEILDAPRLQALMEDFQRLTGSVVAILDLKGKVLVAVGWQEVCTQFHRLHPETAQDCTESDLYLAQNVRRGEYVSYKCKNGLWDVVTPLYVGDVHMGNIYTGQYFLEGEVVDLATFEARAEACGFDRAAYLAAVGRVPRLSPARIQTLMDFLVKFADLVSGMSLANLRATAFIREQAKSAQALRFSESRFRGYFDLGLISMAITSPLKGWVEVNDELCRTLGYGREELWGMTWAELTHPDDLDKDVAEFQRVVRGEIDAYRLEKRFLRKDGAVVYTESSVQAVRHPSGIVDHFVAMFYDITERKLAEQALSLKQTQLQAILDNSPALISIKDLAGNMVLANRNFAVLDAPPLHELIGRNVFDLFPREVAEALWRNDLAALQANTTVQSEERVRHKDGSWHTYLTVKFPLRGGDGQPFGVCAISTDITERKRAEEALQLTRFSIENASDSMFWMRPDASIADVNEAACRSLGYTRAELLELSVPNVDAHYDAEKWPSHFAELRKRGSMVFESEQIRKDGQLFSVEVVANYLKFGEEEWNCAFVRDITMRKQAEAALRESEERWKFAIEGAGDGLWDWNIQTGKAYYSPRYKEMFGYTDAEIGTTSDEWSKRIHPDDAPSVFARLQPYMEGKPGAATVEFRMLCKDGSWQWTLGRGMVVSRDTDGKPMRMIGTNTDITERKQAEEEKHKLQAQLLQSQKMESLGTLAGGVAHDMNNVLSAILGMASSHIGTQTVGSPIYQALDTICKATERGGKMVKSLLTFARQNPTENIQLDMNAILKEQVSLLERTTLAKVRLEMALASDLRPILGDASALTHAFMNLCVNAVDAMPENGTLTLQTRNVDNDWIEIVVEDTGTGMPKEVLEKALDPFYTTKEVGKGTGLGLSMVFSTVTAHRGQMTIQSELGHGTRVMLRFPACEKETQAQVAEPPVAEAAHPQGTLKVLLVDDDELVQSSTQTILEVLGHRINTALSGEEALAKLDAGFEPDLVILDMNMPGLGGFGTLPRLRVLRPEVPVLLVTGRVDQTALTLASAHPGVHLLSKPFGLRELQKQLENIGLG